MNIEKKQEKFTFSFIDENDSKSTKMISVEDPSFLINKMNQLVSQAEDTKLYS